MADGQLAADFESVLKGEAIHLPEFHCGKNDSALLAGLAKDMETHELASEGGGMVNWSKHLKHENPEFSQTFARIVHAMSEYFDVDVYATRLNFYRDGPTGSPSITTRTRTAAGRSARTSPWARPSAARRSSPSSTSRRDRSFPFLSETATCSRSPPKSTRGSSTACPS